MAPTTTRSTAPPGISVSYQFVFCKSTSPNGPSEIRAHSANDGVKITSVPADIRAINGELVRYDTNRYWNTTLRPARKVPGSVACVAKFTFGILGAVASCYFNPQTTTAFDFTTYPEDQKMEIYHSNAVSGSIRQDDVLDNNGNKFLFVRFEDPTASFLDCYCKLVPQGQSIAQIEPSEMERLNIDVVEFSWYGADNGN